MVARILIIEDNANNLTLMDYLLRAFGYAQLHATNGLAGLTMAKCDKPDLILCDIQLPLLDGFSIVKTLKQNASFSTIPIIAVTALAMLGDKRKIIKAGFNGYITKPITPETFVSEVEHFLQPSLLASKVHS